MTAARTQAVMAAALANPLLIEAWVSGRRSRPPSLGDVNLDTLRRFSGLSYKVRHNGLRPLLPVSFRLLRTLEIELDLFAAYFAARTRESTVLARDDRSRMNDLVAFIGDWHLEGDAGHDRLWDVVRHESALAELGMTDAAASEFGEPIASLNADSRLTVVGRLIRHDLTYDPAVIAAAARSIAELGAVPATPLSLGYWRRPGGARIEQIRLDSFAAVILDASNGSMTLNAISQRLLGSTASATFVAMAGELVALGVVRPVGS